VAVSSPAASLPQGVSESVSEGLLREGLLPRDLSSACTEGLPKDVSESLPPPLLVDEEIIPTTGANASASSFGVAPSPSSARTSQQGLLVAPSAARRSQTRRLTRRATCRACRRSPADDHGCAGCTSLREIAAGLNQRGIPAARGGPWSAGSIAGKQGVRRETGNEQTVEVDCSEGVATRTGPESCASDRQARGEALAGERAGRPSSRESPIPAADAVPWAEGSTAGCASASIRPARRGLRSRHG